MAYYHILKERRTNLKLSIQDVSNQTRLAPQYIQAIEEHNLDVFSDDLSFVRYFVHAYSNAIGVNWQAISDEVDVDVNEFAHQRDMALTMAQRRMVEQMASVQKTKKTTKKKKKSSLGWFQKHVSRTSSSLNANQTKIIKMLVLIGIIGLGVLSLVNVGLRSISNQKLATQQELREEQLSKKEQETNKLANQRKKAKEAQALVVNKISGETNAYQLSNIQSDVKTLDLSITLPTKTKITLKKNDESMILQKYIRVHSIRAWNYPMIVLLKLVLRHIQITVFLLMEKKFLLIKRVGSRVILPLSHYKLVRDTKNLLKKMKRNMRIVTMITIMIMVTQMKIYMHKGRM